MIGFFRNHGSGTRSSVPCGCAGMSAVDYGLATPEELADVRGVDRGGTKGAVGRSLLVAVEEGLVADPPADDGAPELRRDLRRELSIRHRKGGR